MTAVNPTTTLLALSVLAAAQAQNPSVRVPVSLEAGLPVVTLQVGSDSPRKFALSPLATESMKRSVAAGKSQGLDLTGGGVDLGKLQFSPMVQPYAQGLSAGVEGVLGQDFLRGKAVGFDSTDSTLTIWPKGLPKSEAESWVAHYPAWKQPQGPRAVALPMTFAHGAYTLPVSVGGIKTTGIISFQYYSSGARFKPGDTHIMMVPGLDSLSEAIAPSMDVGSYSVAWPFFSTNEDARWASAQAGATLDPLLFAKRRLLYDFLNKKLYVEAFSRDGELSLFLSRVVRVPFTIDGENLTLAAIPNLAGVAQLGDLEGKAVVEFAGAPVDKFLKALRGDGHDDMRLVSRLFGLVRTGYSVTLRNADGSTRQLNFAPASPPGGGG